MYNVADIRQKPRSAASCTRCISKTHAWFELKFGTVSRVGKTWHGVDFQKMQVGRCGVTMATTFHCKKWVKIWRFHGNHISRQQIFTKLCVKLEDVNLGLHPKFCDNWSISFWVIVKKAILATQNGRKRSVKIWRFHGNQISLYRIFTKLCGISERVNLGIQPKFGDNPSISFRVIAKKGYLKLSQKGQIKT